MFMKAPAEIASGKEDFLRKIAHGLIGNVSERSIENSCVDQRDTKAVGIRVSKLNKSFGEKHVLKDVDLDIRPGETFSIIGPSGTGKSVLLKLIMRLDYPDSGEIYIDGVPIFDEEKRGMVRDYRYSMVFQSSALFNSLTVGENVGLWLREKRVCGESRIQEIISEKLAMVGLEGTESLMTSELSGGMKKRVAIARSLAMNPDLILYDEPTAELDPLNSDDLANTIIKVRETNHNTTVIVTHDLNFALYLSDRIAMLHDGRIIETGTPDEIKASLNPVVRRFVYTTTKGIKGD
ncbi:MAG: ABC transporter ATP-binding protein [Geobacteraceae bacterium]|nr:ABC transporter ATP-binding protein [Geobacteraceae bacterium]